MIKLARLLSSFTIALLFALTALAPAPALARGAPSSPATFAANPAQQHNPSQAQREYNTEVRLAQEVRHVLVLQPFYTVFDNLEFKVNGEEVTLMGQVVNPALKPDAANAVKHIEGVTEVKNEIQVLPPSTSDERLRLRLYRAIYSIPGFEKYAIQAVPPIHIIVDLGRVTLVGVVDNQMDKTLAITRANQVPGTIGAIKDELRIAGQGS